MRERGRRTIRSLVEREVHQLAALRSRPALADPGSGLDERLREIEDHRERARRTFRHRIDRGDDDLVHQVARIRALSPLATLRRGYAVLSDAEGRALSSVASLEPGDAIHIRVADGRIGATTTSVDRIDLMPDASDEEDDRD
jgi:exodeoxyribonuclease VII large subunit